MAMHHDYFSNRAPSCRALNPSGFTLVEMLVAMAITIVMMAAVVTLFANVSNSVRNRRATIEMSGQLRQVRNVLQQDLQGATCPGITWQRPDSNHGYIEIIEGQHREGDASKLIDAQPNASNPALRNWPPTVTNPEIDHKLSTIPSSNLPFGDPSWVTDGGALGDYDDILMLTVRNEHEPFVGRAPTHVRLQSGTGTNGFQSWEYGSIESPLAEVVWFSVENPGYTDLPESGNSDPSAEGFFGEPGMRTIYRRALLIAPWVNPYRRVNDDGTIDDTFTVDGATFQARPGLMRVLRNNINLQDADRALAALVAFQERYDLSVRLEFDPNIGQNGRWVILANTLGDLTKRENRYEHHAFRPAASGGEREYPFAAVSKGSGYASATLPVVCVPDSEIPPPPPIFQSTRNEEGRAIRDNEFGLQNVAVAYALSNPFPPSGSPVRNQYKWRPFAFINQPQTSTLATARVMLNNNGEVVGIVHGLVPLSGDRRGEDVMMTGVLAFDLRVYDPGAPIFRHLSTDTMLTPTDPGWLNAYTSNDNMNSGNSLIGRDNREYPYIGQGAYVDLGYGYNTRRSPPMLPSPTYHGNFLTSAPSWFFEPRGLMDVYGTLLAPGYTVYDTWSFHYENNGLNEDGMWLDGNTWRAASLSTQPWRQDIDTGIDGLDNNGVLGVDDPGERETVPPYDKPLRGLQVLIRSYEPDSRAIRQVRVNQHFMQE